jgi:uncharacterized protein YoxC
MDNGLNAILITSLVLITGCTVVFFVFLIQVLNKLKRILTKVELRIDNFELTQEEIKLKILNFIEEILQKIKSYGKIDIFKTEGVSRKTKKVENK